MAIENPHLAYPFRMADNGELAVLEQRSLDEGRMCAHVLMRTPRGARPLAPEVGVEDPTFTYGIDAELLEADLNENGWMPEDFVVRVSALPVTGAGAQAIRVVVAYAEDDDIAEEAL